MLKPSKDIDFLKLKTNNKNKLIEKNIIPLMLKDDVMFKGVVA
jgi:hypothetical protein